MESLQSINKNAQAWGTDLTLAVAIFSISLVAIYFYAINDSRFSTEKIDSLFYEGEIISTMILSSGYPENWDSTNVMQVGILDKGVVNSTKLERFKALNYPRTKALFNTQNEYYFYIADFESETSVGNPDYEDSKNLIKITRVVVYDNRIVPAYLYVFENG